MVYAGKGIGVPTGIDSYSHPLYVNELQLRWLENAVTQGAFVQTRPGYKTRLTFDVTSGTGLAWSWYIINGEPVVHPQMMMSFTPTDGAPQLVFAISGTVFWCNVNSDGSIPPQTIANLIPGFFFNPNSDQLVGCRCTQSASIIAGQYVNNIAPRNLLVIQDGVNRAGVWDGVVGVQMNPQKKITITGSGDTLYPEAWNQTRTGLWMAWSGNRLFVANGHVVYASDLNDPTHFTEELTLTSLPSVTFPEDVTGMVDRGTSGTNRSQVVVFTATTTSTLWSGIQARLPNASLGAKGWAFIDDFKTKIFDNVGCVAGKSIIVHRGLLYWKSQYGIVMFDGSSTVNSSQNLPPIDQEMAYSKLRVAPSAEGADLTCSGIFTNYVWWSVPVGKVINGRRYNSQTQVLDRQTTTVRSTGAGGAFSAGTTGWQGVWTGIRPVEWANVNIGGKERTYALSLDSAGVVRIWQGFQANRADNGKPIPWFMETRLHPVQPTIFEYATFRSFRLLVDQIKGRLDIVGMWRGMKGTYHELLTTTIQATPGTILLPLPQFTPITNSTAHQSLAMQSRTVISRTLLGPQNTCTSQGVESSYPDATDHAFGLALQFTGRGAVSAYTFKADTQPDNSEGTAQTRQTTGVDESGFNLVPEGACPAHIAGTAPTYTAHDAPGALAVCPYLPSATLSVDYDAPQA
jgi:hypothetical protein